MLGTIEELALTTYRIRTDISVGSGFLINSNLATGATTSILVTNKHVVRGSTMGWLNFTLATGAEGDPDIGNTVELEIEDFERRFLFHPDPEIDLAALPLRPILDDLVKQGHKPFSLSMAADTIASQDFLDTLDAVEDVLMLGYPNGLWDQHNNLPLARRGVTATSPARRFNDGPEFMIDCACFPGSSGSPVFLYNSGAYRDKRSNGTLYAGPRMKLLGVLYSGPTIQLDGTIVSRPIPMHHQSVISETMINLGYCVRADEILIFARMLDEVIAKNAPLNSFGPDFVVSLGS